MKNIEAIVQPFRVEAVREALKGIGIDGRTVTEVRGHGCQQSHAEVCRGPASCFLLPKVKLEMVVPADRMNQVVDTLSSAARTGKIGDGSDGKIFIYDVADAVRIRNDDRGELALGCYPKSVISVQTGNGSRAQQ
jgi:nitrogen regulatory protein P-II 1